MKKTLLILLALGCLISTYGQPKKRAESFFGIHFDFHASDQDKEIGKTFTFEMIDSFLTKVNPDFVQVDCKGHPGYSSYPTKIGNQAGGYTKDILKIWREATSKHNVALYVHYSGIIDKKAITDHPEWARTGAEGKSDPEKASYMGSYDDKLLIPQLKEISDYGVNGAWIDGECWATSPDYSPQMLEGFTRKTGIKVAPISEDSVNYKEFIEFNRWAFRQHIKKYTDAIHAYNPDFQITSNWAFSSMMPEPVDVNVDYLSGDVAGQNCVYNSAYQARCLALQGKPWDLMSWGFTYDFSVGMAGPKSLVQLEQEASEIMAMGGGFQCYLTQNRDGSIKPFYAGKMAELADFCRERQPYCQGTKTVPQIAIWYSVYNMKQKTNQIYGWNSRALEGNLALFLDGQNNVEILMDHQLKKHMSEYHLVVIPEWDNLDSLLKLQALEYVKNGGNLMVIGANAVKGFEPQLGVEFEGNPETQTFYLGYSNQMTATKSLLQKVNIKPGTQTFGNIYRIDDFRSVPIQPIATIADYGKGKICGLYMDIGVSYYTYQASGFSKIVTQLILQLVPESLVRVSGSDYLHTSISMKDGKWYVHLINSAGNHFNNKVYEYDQLPQTGELLVDLNPGKKISKATLQPGNKPLKLVSINGKYRVKVPSVEVYSILQIEE